MKAKGTKTKQKEICLVFWTNIPEKWLSHLSIWLSINVHHNHSDKVKSNLLASTISILDIVNKEKMRRKGKAAALFKMKYRVLVWGWMDTINKTDQKLAYTEQTKIHTSVCHKHLQSSVLKKVTSWKNSSNFAEHPFSMKTFGVGKNLK